MMMCLEAGGMPLYYNREAEEHWRSIVLPDGYRPHSGGVREPLGDVRGVNLRLVPPNHVVKTVRERASLCNLDCRMIVMERNHSETIASMRHWGQPHEQETLEWFEREAERFKILVGRNKHIRDCTTVNFRDLVLNPTRTLEQIDWPFDKEAASKVPDPAWYRHRTK